MKFYLIGIKVNNSSDKNCWLLDSNCGLMVSKVTTLLTALNSGFKTFQLDLFDFIYYTWDSNHWPCNFKKSLCQLSSAIRHLSHAIDTVTIHNGVCPLSEDWSVLLLMQNINKTEKVLDYTLFCRHQNAW